MTKQSPPISFRDAALEAQIARRTPPGHSRNQVAKDHLARYYRLMAYEAGSTPITARELLALRIATSDRDFDAHVPAMLGMSVYDAFQAGSLDDSWDDSTVLELMNKLDRLRAAQQWALIDSLELGRVDASR